MRRAATKRSETFFLFENDWVRDYLEKQLGGTALFFSGSIGKVSPLGDQGDQVSLLDPETGQIADDGTWLRRNSWEPKSGDLPNLGKTAPEGRPSKTTCSCRSKES
jgi:hypothetical protein